VKGDAASRIALEHAIHHHAMKTKFQWRLTPASSALSVAAVTKVQMGVQQRAKAVDEDHGASAGRCTDAGTVLPQHPRDGGEEDVQCGIQNCRITFQVVAQALGHRVHPLAHRPSTG